MATHISTGIDIGTHQVKVVVVEYGHRKGRPFRRIIGTGISESKGLRYGYIVNQHDVIQSIQEAIRRAETASKIKIKSALMSMGGVGLDGIISSGLAITTRADEKITDLDIEKATQASKNAIPEASSLNTRVIHTIPLGFKVDGKKGFGRPGGMHGRKLEVETLFITTMEQHLNDMIMAIEEVGIEIEDIVAAPIASGIVNTTRAQRIAGCVLADIGSETVSIVVYENDNPISVKVFPIGSTDITNDIALGLRIPLDKAEEIKIKGTSTLRAKKELDDIILARLKDIFEIIENHLKKIGKNDLLPAGIILTGGGSGISTIEDLAKAALRIPAKTNGLGMINKQKNGVKDSFWSVAYGLCLLGASSEKENSGVVMMKNAKNATISWVRQFLP